MLARLALRSAPPSCRRAFSASPQVVALADSICELKLVEVKQLNDLLKERLGLPDFAGGMPMMAMPAGGAAPAAAAPAEEEEAAAPAVKTKFDVKLLEFDKILKIKLIKEIREIAKLGLKEAKDVVDNVPSVFMKDISRAEADEAMDKLKAFGAVCALE